MKNPPKELAVGCMLLGLLALPASAQIQATQIAAQPSLGGTARPDRVVVLDVNGAGEFTTLQAAISAVPEGGLILVRPGDYLGATVNSKSLRIQGTTPQGARIHGVLEVSSLTGSQEVQVNSLAFADGFRIEQCLGPVSFAGCISSENDVLISTPPGVHFGNYPDCGIGLSRHEVIDSQAVTLTDCNLTGRNGYQPTVCDGVPGEHALFVEDSRVAVYGTQLWGGNGSDAYGCHGAYAGAGGDGALVQGASSRLLYCGGFHGGGTGGRDFENDYHNGCPGVAFRTVDGALVEPCPPDHLEFRIAPLVAAGALPFYEIIGPPGANVFMMITARRGWREFPASIGVLHLGGPLTIIPLGVIPSSGRYSRPLPAPSPTWPRGYASLELQIYGQVAGQERYSGPRTLHVVR